MLSRKGVCIMLRVVVQTITVVHGLQSITEEFRPNQPPAIQYSATSATQGTYHV